jgi:hypothetical protein
MKRILNIKVFILIAYVGIMLYQFFLTWRELAVNHSVDMAAGFIMGLAFMSVLILCVKLMGYAYGEIKSWIAESRALRGYDTGGRTE